MSTSPRRAPEAANTEEAAAVLALEPFPYDLVVESRPILGADGIAGDGITHFAARRAKKFTGMRWARQSNSSRRISKGRANLCGTIR